MHTTAHGVAARTGVEVGEEVRRAVAGPRARGEGLPEVLQAALLLDVAVREDEVRRLVALLWEARRERADDAADAVGLLAVPAVIRLSVLVLRLESARACLPRIILEHARVPSKAPW